MANSTILPANRREGYAAVPGVAGPVVPFDQASHSVFEEGPSWSGIEIKAEAQTLKQEGLPANGFLQRVWVKVETETEGKEEAGSIAENFPYNILSRLEFQDQGGKPLSSMTGFNWFLMDLFGGVLANPNLTEMPDFSKTIKAPAFTVIIPCEINPTGFGALTNLTETTKFQLQPTIAQESKIYSVKPTTLPKLKIRTWLELWPLPQARTKPEPGFPEGRLQEQRPPLEGTIQFFTEQANVKTTAGENQFTFSRVGQMIRNQILVTSNEAGTKRESGILPTVVQYLWARNIFRSIDVKVLQERAYTQIPQLTGLVSAKYLTGVYPLIYSTGQGRQAGENGLNTLLATVNSTKQELKGEFKAGLITVCTNDVAIAAVSEQGRRETPGWAATEATGTE